MSMQSLVIEEQALQREIDELALITEAAPGVTETAAQEKADGKFFRFLRNRPGSLEGFCIFEVVHER